MADKLRFIEDRTKLLSPLDPHSSVISENRNNFPSSTWSSSSHDQYDLHFTPGPPPTLPPITRPDDAGGNNPQSKTVYHILKIDRKKVCNVESLMHSDLSETYTPQSETREKFPRNPLPKLRHRQPGTESHGIVPGTYLSGEAPERVLPACSRAKTLGMSTTPFWQYSGKKKRLKQPYQDGGVVYNTEETTPRNSDNFWLSVTSMNGKGFSKKRAIDGPNTSLSPQFFEGYNRDTLQTDRHQIDKNEIRPYNQKKTYQ